MLPNEINPRSDKLLLTAGELAHHLRVSRSKAYAIMRCGEIPTVRMGRCIRVRRQDVDRYIQRNTIHAFDQRV